MNENLCVNKTDFHMKGFALGLALKQGLKATRKSPIDTYDFMYLTLKHLKGNIYTPAFIITTLHHVERRCVASHVC